MTLKPGDKAPAFKVNDQNGNVVSLSDLKGKKTIIYFYPKDMTPGCTAEACNLRDNYREMQKQGYEIFGVSTDNEKLHQKFIAKEKLPFRLLADTDRAMHDAYGTWIEKSMYGRKYMGTARVTFVINEKGIIEDVIEKVDTKNHAAQILRQDVKQIKPAKTVAKKAEKAVKKATKKAARKSSKPVARKSSKK